MCHRVVGLMDHLWKITQKSNIYCIFIDSPGNRLFSRKPSLNLNKIPFKRIFSPESPEPTCRPSIESAQIIDAMLDTHLPRYSSHCSWDRTLKNPWRNILLLISGLSSTVFPLPAAYTSSVALSSSQFCGNFAGWMVSVYRIGCGSSIRPNINKTKIHLVTFIASKLRGSSVSPISCVAVLLK